jgi:hypothetical protein
MRWMLALPAVFLFSQAQASLLVLRRRFCFPVHRGHKLGQAQLSAPLFRSLWTTGRWRATRNQSARFVILLSLVNDTLDTPEFPFTAGGCCHLSGSEPAPELLANT